MHLFVSWKTLLLNIFYIAKNTFVMYADVLDQVLLAKKTKFYTEGQRELLQNRRQLERRYAR